MASWLPSQNQGEMERTSAVLPLPDGFLTFLKANGIDPSIYTSINSTPRYIRFKPGYESCIEEIEKEIDCKLQKVSWLKDFYSLPHNAHVANSRAYKEGKMYGIDAASGAAVSALCISEGDHVLDLCAAPGAKLCMILDLLSGSGSLTGVDVAPHRLAACRTMLQKYALGDRCRLFVADGTSFSLLPKPVHSESKTGESAINQNLDVFKEWTSRRSYKERKRSTKANKNAALTSDNGTQYPELIFYGNHSGILGLSKSEMYSAVVDENAIISCGYDKVIVDAECTHDGSIRHIQKFEHWGWLTLQRRVLDAERTDQLTSLQLSLLSNGFRLLKVGGFLVYSTCSLTTAQNEDVVEQFLLDNPTAELQEIEEAKSWPSKDGGIPKTLRFDPMESQTSGLFVAKFMKLASRG